MISPKGIETVHGARLRLPRVLPSWENSTEAAFTGASVGEFEQLLGREGIAYEDAYADSEGRMWIRFDDVETQLQARDAINKAYEGQFAVATTFASRAPLWLTRMGLKPMSLGLDLRGVASFHGSLGKTHPAQKGDVKARVLVCHGEDDSFVSAEEQAGFRQEMDDLGVDYKFVAYPGAKHGFTNPDATENGLKYNLPLAYNEDVDRESWQEMKAFWAEVLG